ncbi:MAG: hypothetical protein V1925_04995 [Candidatus Omnitrophota bacterium]
MYIPLELASGKLLYRDICYVYGPFPPYFNALLYKIFSPSLYTLLAGGILTTCLASFLIYKISRLFLNILFSTFAVLTFLTVFAFGHYVYLGNYNFILPYTYAATGGLLLALSAFYFFSLALLKSRPRYKYLGCLFVTLASLSKIEIGIAIAFSLAAVSVFNALAFKAKPFSKPGALINQLAFYMLIPLIISAGVYGLFLASITKPALRNFIFDLVFLNVNSGYIFTRWMSGLSDLTVNLLIILKSSLAYLILVIVFSAAGALTGRITRLLAGGLLIPLVLFFINKYFPFDWQYRPLPIILFIIMLMSICGLLRRQDPAERKNNILLLAFSLFSLMLMFRMLFFARAAHFGFYILAPGMAAYYIFFLKLIPGRLPYRINRNFYYTAFIIVFSFFILKHLGLSRFCYENRTLEISAPRGRMRVFNTARENRCRELIAYLKANTEKESSLVVFPEGLPINFLAERKNPLHYYTYVPINLASKGVVEDIIKEMESEKINYVALNQRDTREFGCRAFGIDYAQPIWEYIKNNYTLIKQFGPFPYTTEEFGIALFKRKAR